MPFIRTQWRESCVVVKPRQPRFMIVKWNNRAEAYMVEEKLQYCGVRLEVSLIVRVVSRRMQQQAWATDISQTNRGAWRFYCYRDTKLPVATVRF